MRKVRTLWMLTLLLISLPLGLLAGERPRESYLRRVRKDVDDITVRLKELEAKGAAFSGEQKEKFDESLKALWNKERLARVQLDQLQKAHGEKWKKMRKVEDNTLIGLRKSYQYMMNHLPK